METISAVYEDGVFKPLRPVALLPGARVRVEAEPTTADLAERTYQQLLSEGATADEARSIVDNFRLAWDVYDSLTEEQQKGLDDCRIDQVNFFNRPSP
jgi:predicted DNA-binding antitoxin AbrB/MazE fold protein